MRRWKMAGQFGAGAALAGAVACAAAPQPSIDNVWRPASGGGFEHLQSGLACPARHDGLRRTGVSVADAFGLDVGCGYSGGGATLSLRLARRDEDSAGLEAEAAQAKHDLLQAEASRRPQLVSEIRYAQDGLNWAASVYGEDGGRRSGVWVADLKGWTLTFRASYPDSQDASILADIRVISASAAASAGGHLDLCAKAATVMRTGSQIADRDQIRSAAWATGKLGVRPGAEAPVVWCVEPDEDEDGHPVLFWRGLSPDGADARVDRVSLTRSGSQLVLSLAPDVLTGAAGAPTTGEARPTRWVATMQQGEQTLIYAYYAGRPSPEMALGALTAIAAGRTKALGVYRSGDRDPAAGPPGR